MRGVEAPEAERTFVKMDEEDEERAGAVDEVGLPLVYDKKLIQAYWEGQGGALQQRWTEFLALSVPFLTRIVTLALTGGADELNRNQASLAKDARIIFEKLGPTYIKAGQMMSVRPDVLPQAALDELAVLQDSVKPFETSVAIAAIERELGKPLEEVFSEISEQPVAAASLAQVYKARLAATGELVAVKVQRPAVLETVSKDLYVLRRAAEVYQGLIDRFAPQQRTDYVSLLNEWAVGFYTELDFLNEAKNQISMKELLAAENKEGFYVPEVKMEYCSRRILVTEWVDGVKLSECEPEEIRELIKIGQEVFLTQLLQIGFFHADPHPGNLLKMNDTSKGKIALIDFGLVASIRQEEMDLMVNSVIHLANKDYRSLVDDFIALEILPADCDRAVVEPLMDKALSPYVKGGGAKRYEEELKKMYGMDGTTQSNIGGFQAMSQDFLAVVNDVPFSIPPYFALLARAVVTLEGLALIGDPDYKLVMETYPFVARKLLSEDRPELQRALQEVLYATPGGERGGALRGERLSVIINSALGVVAKSEAAFVDFDTVPEDGVPLGDAVKYLLSPQARSIRSLIEQEAVNGADLLLRQGARKAFSRFFASLPPQPLPFLPKPEEIPAPVLLPTRATADAARAAADAAAAGESPSSASTTPAAVGAVVPVLLRPGQVLDAAAPKLTLEEELYARSLVDLAEAALGREAAAVLSGDALAEPEAAAAVALRVVASGRAPGLEAVASAAQNALDRAEGAALATTSGEGGVGAASAAAGAQEQQRRNADDLARALLEELGENERAELRASAERVLAQLVSRAVSRLSSAADDQPTPPAFGLGPASAR